MESNASTNPRNEAISILNDVLSNLTSTDKNLKSVLRKCQLVCELLKWDQHKNWFHQELNGYNRDSILPNYRKISGIRTWEVSGTVTEQITWNSEKMVYGVDPGIFEEEPDILEVWSGIDWFLGAINNGYKITLNETKIVQSPKKGMDIPLKRVRIFNASEIYISLAQLEKYIYDFVSSAYVQLKYSNVIGNIWTDYQTHVDKVISQLGMTQHLSAIETNLLSNNSEGGRSAAFECRNLLNDLANHLWRDTRKRYEYLIGNSDEKTLDVSQGKFGNRIAAYLHQKGIAGTQGKYLRDETFRLATAIQSLISYQSEAHDPITLQNARSVAIATYILIGEIITRTDLIPIDVYNIPKVGLSSADKG